MKPSIRTPPLLTICIALSGSSALIYELIWFRRLANVVGSTVQSASITTAVFLAGLALGAVWLGRYSDCVKRPLLTYALLELFIAGSGLLVPLLINWSELFVAGAPGRTTAALFFASAILLLPTMAMGGTLPVLCRALAGTEVAERFAFLYAMNTAGGAAGCLAAGFVLIPLGGEQLAIGIAVVGNLLAVAGVLWVGRSTVSSDKAIVLPSPSEAETRAPLWPLAALALTGFATLAAQILWLRLFPLFIGNTTYAFTLVLVLFLVGIATGSALYRRFLIRAAPLAALCVPAMLLAGAFLPTILAADRLAYLFYELELAAHYSVWLLTAGRASIGALLVLPPTIASGVLLPALVALAEPQENRPGLQVGRALFANTSGAVAGSLAVPLLLIPYFGLQGSFRLAGSLALLLAVCLLVKMRSRVRWQWGVSLSLLALLCLPLPWDRRLLSSGVYIYAESFAAAGGLSARFAEREIVAYEEGTEATITVFQQADGARYFSVNGKVDGGTNDMPTQVLLGQLPLLIHPQPQRILVIGLGTGITLAETLKFPDINVECSEIEPGVIRASKYFVPEHGGVLANSRVKLLLGDARQQLLVGSGGYDVIISEPSNPWQSGNSRLFTRDFYQLATARLNPGGVFCQWLPIYDLPPEYLRSAVATFLETFPHAVGFLYGRDDLILLARRGDSELVIPYAQFTERWHLPGVSERQRSIGNDSPGDLLARHYFGGESPLALFAGDAPINSDRRNRLEFMPKLSRRHANDNLKMLGVALEALPVSRWVNTLQLEKHSHSMRQELAEKFFNQRRWREAKALTPH